MEIIDDGLDLVVVVEIKVGKLEVFLKGIKEDLLVGVNVADKGKENVKGKCGIFSLSSGVDDVSLAEREKSGGGYHLGVVCSGDKELCFGLGICREDKLKELWFGLSKCREHKQGYQVGS